MRQTRASSSYGASEYKPITMNDMPTPGGSWQEHHNAKQSKYNMVLVAGVAALIGTVAYVSTLFL